MVLPPTKPTLLDATINKNNLLVVQQNIKKHSPTPKKVQIVAVTKTLSFNAIQSAFNNNIFLIGESKIQETQQKKHKKRINKEAQLHLIGHLQSNKVKKAIKLYHTIQSVDSVGIAETINRCAQNNQTKQNIFLQIKIEGSSTPFGFLEKEIYKITAKLKQLNNIKIVGIMAIGPNTTNKTRINKAFKAILKTKTKIQENIVQTCKFLSIGMSNDYIFALQNGATHIRLGTILYKKRETGAE